MAIGKSGEYAERDKIKIFIGDEQVTNNGLVYEKYSEVNVTSHSKISKEERENLGIFDGLLRFSVGIEDHNDIINDLKQAFSKI